MKPLSSKEIYGNWCTLLLPIRKDESIDYSRLSNTMDRLVAVRPDGIYSNGTAGEFYNLTEEEYDKIAEMLAEKCNKNSIPFQIGVSHMSPMISLERLKRITHLKPSAVQLILPDWFIPTMEESMAFMKVMADAAGDIGLVLYNPPHAKKRLSPQDLLTLKKEIPSVVGIKVPDGDNVWYKEMIPVAEQMSVFLPGHKIATGYQRGVCHGAYSNMACLNPKAAQIWSDQIRTDIEAALELEKRINLFLNKYIISLIEKEKYANQAVDKMLVVMGEWADLDSRLRWPYRWVSKQVIEDIHPKAKELLPEFFIPLS